MERVQHINPENGCIGCTACYTECPKDAITMVANKEGFYNPHVDESLCIACKKCLTICPLLNSKAAERKVEPACSYAYSKNLQERMHSCSGGVFYELAKKVLSNNGIVCGCIWNDNFIARHICTDDLSEVKKMRGSKYVQSDLGDCFKEIKGYLKEGRFVLFSGTGCQTTALKRCVGQKHAENLLTCAVICGGVPSPKVWEYYKSKVEEDMGAPFSELDLRNKKRGWLMPELYAEFQNGKSVREVLLQENLYGTNFGSGLIINKECLNCQFKFNQVETDLLISDDWGIDKKRLKESKNKGSSAVIALTSTGKKALDAINSEMVTEEGNLQHIIDSHLVLTKNHPPNQYRDCFFESFNEDNILDKLDQYFKMWQDQVHMSTMAKVLYRLKIYTPIYNFYWKLRH